MSDMDARGPDVWAGWEPLRGPACPLCWRDDGSHAMGCEVERYVAEWHRLRQAEAQQMADMFWERSK